MSESSYIICLHSLLKIYLFRVCVKKAVVFTYLVLWLILVYISVPEKTKHVALFFFRRDISNGICDLVLYLLSDGWNMSWIYDGTIPFLYLKIVVAMQASDLSGTGSQFIFLKWAASMWEPGGKSKQRRVHLFYAVWNLCFRYLLRSGN